MSTGAGDATINQPSQLVIKQEDPFYTDRGYLDFQVLREEGLEHIQALSGKVWTDYNLHDPGITILETLCYALIDLGYRAALPSEDLFAAPSSGTVANFSHDDNFFTPLQILSCNPTTTADFRRLLLEVNGVRNAWLTPAQAGPPDGSGEPPLYLCREAGAQATDSKLSCQNSGQDCTPVPLNGLWSVLIEKDPAACDQKVFEEARNILSAHRNLCEDFKEIVILCPLEIGICADIEIDNMADPATVYAAVLQAISAFIAPEVRYYTLQQLLDKGKPIEDIFAGRPLLKHSHSVGFVDIDELEGLPFRSELHASDLYRVILAVTGVVSVRELTFQTPATSLIDGSSIQRLRIPDRYAPAFSLERTCVQLRRGQNLLQFDKQAAGARVARKGKSIYSRADLDLPIPAGRLDPERTTYDSIQQEFPKAYAIGVGGLSKDATPLRKAQALQLQGYLLFYDQLLANYLAQLANLRSLFSLRQESKRDSSSRRTYINQGLLDTVPAVEQLLQVSTAGTATNGSVIAVPVADDAVFARELQILGMSCEKDLHLEGPCGPEKEDVLHFGQANVVLRDISVKQAQRDLGRGHYTVEVYQDTGGFFFVIRFTDRRRWLFAGCLRYLTAAQARSAGDFAAFLGTRPDYYRNSIQRNHLGAGEYRFDLVANAAADASCLQNLLENESLYEERREAFLDHLLARFASQFTDYVLLRFDAAERPQRERRQAIEDKSAFLHRYDDLSRDRGRAFDYLEPSWGSGNVSGYERRTSALAGIHDWTRRRLCKFEVVECYRLRIDNPNGEPWFSSRAAYHSEQDLLQARAGLLAKLRNPENYDELKSQFVGFPADAVRWFFSEIAVDENIEVSRHVYALQLNDAHGNICQQSSDQNYANESLAWRGLPQFLGEINAAAELGIELEEIGKNSRLFLNVRHLRYRLEPLTNYKWHRYDERGKKAAVANKVFANPSEAIDDFVQGGDWSGFITQEDGFGWRLKDRQGAIVMASLVRYEDPAAAIKGLWEALGAAQVNSNLFTEPIPGTPEHRILLATLDGKRLGASPPPYIASVEDRDAALKKLRGTLKRLPAPVKIEEEPPRYRWYLYRVAHGTTVETSAQIFNSPEEAIENIAESVRLAVAERTSTEITQAVYTVKLRPIPSHYRFVYRIDLSQGNSLAVRSVQDFESTDAAKSAYGTFVRSLPNLTRVQASVNDVSGPVAILADDTVENRRRTDERLTYMHAQYAAVQEKAADPPGWIYRLIDKDHPIAMSADKWPSKDAAQAAKPNACGFKPYQWACETPIISVVVPKLDPNRYHYAISLPDDSDKESLFLVSYESYDTASLALAAGQNEWVELIGLASDRANYNGKKKIRTEEIYSHGSDSPCKLQSYRAVLPTAFTEEFGIGAVAKAVELANRFPIRLVEKTDRSGTPIASVYKFQGYDTTSNKLIWVSSVNYATLEEAVNAYRVFVAALGNPDSCRLVCEHGHFRIHLIEILAESIKEFGSADEAWDEPQPMTVDACGQQVCVNHGVRLFADAAASEESFIAQHQNACHGFDVVGRDYRVARHTCAYSTVNERDQAAKRAYAWASALTFHDYKQTGGQGDFLRFDLGEGYYLKSLNPVAAGDGGALVDRWFYLAITKRNYLKVNGGFQLIDRLQGDTALAEVARDSAAGPFNIDAFLQLAREYPVFQRDGAYSFRLYYPENGTALDEVLEKFICDEIPEKIQKPGPFCGKPYIFESVQSYPCRAAAEQAFKDFYDLLKTRANYEEEAESGIGPFSFTIVDPNQVLARYPGCYPDQGGAMAAAERARSCVKDQGMHLVEHILLRPQAHDAQAACKCLLPACPEAECTLTWEEDVDDDDPCKSVRNPAIEYIPGVDPYSFWATLVLPGWHRHFKNKEKRKSFKEMLYREAPAMVGLNILWLSPKQMREFDEAFRIWLEWQRSPKELCEDADKENALCNLVNCIKGLRDDPPCPVDEVSPVECACLSSGNEPPYKCVVQADQLFWLRCDRESKLPGPAAVIPPQTAAPVETPEALAIDPTAVRHTIDEREKLYRENVRAAANEKIKSTRGYKQAEFFVDNPPSPNQFKKLALQILKHDMGRRGTQTYRSFVSILQNATWHVLDKLVMEYPEGVPEDVKALLVDLVAAMKAKGLDTGMIANNWQSEGLATVFPASAIQHYLRLLREVTT